MLDDSINVGGGVDGREIQPDSVNGTESVGPDPTVSEINDVIAESGPNTIVEVVGDVSYSDTSVDVTDGVILDARKATFKLADGTDDDSNSAINVPTGVEDATVFGATIDGNVENQSNLGSHPDTPTAHGIVVQSSCRDVRVANCTISDTIRSGIVDEGERTIVTGNRVRNSGYDHLLYASRASDSVYVGNLLEGYARGGMIAVSTSDHTTSGVRLSDTTITNVVTDNPHGADTVYAVNFRQTVGSPRDNVIDGMTVDARGSEGVQLWVSQPQTEIRGYHYFGPITDHLPRGGASSLVRCDRDDPTGSTIEAKLVVTATNVSNLGYCVDIWRPDLTLNLDIEAPQSDVRGLRLDGTDNPVDVSVTGDFKTGANAIRAVGDTNPITFNRLQFADLNGGGLNTSGTVNLEFVDSANGTISTSSI